MHIETATSLDQNVVSARCRRGGAGSVARCSVPLSALRNDRTGVSRVKGPVYSGESVTMNAQAASVADEQAQPLDRIGDRYQIESTLGSGGMGTVLAGRDLLLDRPVAIKVLPLDKRQNERATQRLHREARAMARIAHPGVVQV